MSVDRNGVVLSPSDLVDLANYCYDRQQDTKLEERHVNNFVEWIRDWLVETRVQRSARNNEYIRTADKRTPEHHSQLVKLAERMGMLK